MITDLSLFDPATIEKEKRYLLDGHEEEGDPIRTVVENWIANGGGINGEPYGLHVDHINWDLVDVRVQEWLTGRWKGKPMSFNLPDPVLRKAERMMASGE